MVKQMISALIAGALFGFGLCLSRMVDPAVVMGFLDVTGKWDPRLLLVMAGGLAVALVCFPWILRHCSKPVCGDRFYVPQDRSIDTKLVFGSVLFGVGWGLGGVCPGPAVAALAFGLRETYIFLAAMLIGMVIFEKLNKLFDAS